MDLYKVEIPDLGLGPRAAAPEGLGRCHPSVNDYVTNYTNLDFFVAGD